MKPLRKTEDMNWRANNLSFVSYKIVPSLAADPANDKKNVINAN